MLNTEKVRDWLENNVEQTEDDLITVNHMVNKILDINIILITVDSFIGDRFEYARV